MLIFAMYLCVFEELYVYRRLRSVFVILSATIYIVRPAPIRK
jgi:hypothetical protein